MFIEQPNLKKVRGLQEVPGGGMTDSPVVTSLHDKTSRGRRRRHQPSRLCAVAHGQADALQL